MDALTEFCRGLFDSMPRADQRRWGEAYVRGLATVPGRKSIPRICERVCGEDSVQSLQQFVNQSPWAWEPVRRALAERLSGVLRPRAWVVREIVFPKNGDGSAGVARQYSPARGRTLNCQRALAVFLAGDEGGVPVNWRLLMPSCWDGAQDRRAKAGVPAVERARPDWQHLLDALDEMVADWALPPLPVVLSVHEEADVRPVLRGLEERGLACLLEVPASSPFVRRSPAVRPSGRGASASATAWLSSSAGDGGELLRARQRLAADIGQLTEGVGLRHFEGRSFRGWHHHVTLASTAHAYRIGRRPAS